MLAFALLRLCAFASSAVLFVCVCITQLVCFCQPTTYSLSGLWGLASCPGLLLHMRASIRGRISCICV